MARRMSNRDRIDRMREEAAAAARERKDKEKERATRAPATSRSSASPAPPARMKIVWAVKEPAGKIVETFPYPRKEAAEARASALTEETGRDHFVRPHRIPME